MNNIGALYKDITSSTEIFRWNWVVGNSESTNHSSATAGVYKTSAKTIDFYLVLIILSINLSSSK